MWLYTAQLINAEAKDLHSILSRIDLADIVAFAAIKAKESYNRKHILIFFTPGDIAFLYIYKGYNILVVTNKKIE